MRTTTTQNEQNTKLKQIQAALSGDGDFLKPLVKAILEEVMEAEMEEALGPVKASARAGVLGTAAGTMRGG